MSVSDKKQRKGYLVKILLTIVIIIIVSAINAAAGGSGGNPLINLMGIGGIIALFTWKPGDSKENDNSDNAVKPLNKEDSDV